MKKIFLLMIAALALFSSCQKPEYVLPTVERQGITSLTAYFTSGKFVDQQLAKLEISDPDADRYVIPIPWFFPEESDDVTTIHMTRVRVRAQLANNCKIDPPLTILDLTQEHKFTYTNARGESREIIITGQRVKSSNAKAMSFKLVDPYLIEGFINDDAKEIYLFTTDDLNGFSAEAVASAHSSVKEDLTIKKNYNEEQVVTMVAHDGTEHEYKIIKKYPTKIPYGFRQESVRQLFNFEPVSRLNFPAYTVTVNPSLAYADNSLIVSFGDGTAPMVLDALTGVKKGELNAGFTVGSVTNDEGGNILITTHAMGGETCNIYRSKTVNGTPELFHSFDNITDVPVGFNVKVHGNIDTDAVIILTHEGIAGVTETSKYTRAVVSGGAVVSTENVDLAGLGLSWGAAPTNAAKVVPVSAKPEDGVMLCYYSRNIISYINGNGVIAAELDLGAEPFSANGNYNTNIMESKSYNNATYAIHLITSHFPMWGVGPKLNIFDISSPTSIKDGTTVLSNNNIEWYQTAASGCAAADVVAGASADGFKIYIYYFDHNCGVIGGYVADCIDI